MPTNLFCSHRKLLRFFRLALCLQLLSMGCSEDPGGMGAGRDVDLGEGSDAAPAQLDLGGCPRTWRCEQKKVMRCKSGSWAQARDCATINQTCGECNDLAFCTSGKVVKAASGEFGELKTKIQQLTSGGTVCIPSGDFKWKTGEGYLPIPGGVNIIGAGPTKTRLTATVKVSVMFDVNHHGSQSDPLRISGISFVGWIPNAGFTNSGSAISVASVKGFRIDHCHFEGFSYIINVGAVAGKTNAVGVIDHCYLKKGNMP